LPGWPQIERSGTEDERRRLARARCASLCAAPPEQVARGALKREALPGPFRTRNRYRPTDIDRPYPTAGCPDSRMTPGAGLINDKHKSSPGRRAHWRTHAEATKTKSVIVSVLRVTPSVRVRGDRSFRRDGGRAWDVPRDGPRAGLLGWPAAFAIGWRGSGGTLKVPAHGHDGGFTPPALVNTGVKSAVTRRLRPIPSFLYGVRRSGNPPPQSAPPFPALDFVRKRPYRPVRAQR